MDNKYFCYNHRILNLCIKQGYVTPECILDGVIILELIKEGKNPCIVCNENCHNAKKEYLPEELISLKELYYLKRNEYKNKQRVRQDRIDKRKQKYSSINKFMFVDTVFYPKSLGAVITVISLLEEKMYTHNCKNIEEVVNGVSLICHKYNVERVFVETHGFGIAVADELLAKIIDDNIDIIPIRASRMMF